MYEEIEFKGKKNQVRDGLVEYSCDKGFKGSRWQPPEEPSAEITGLEIWHPVLKKYINARRYEKVMVKSIDDILDSIDEGELLREAAEREEGEYEAYLEMQEGMRRDSMMGL